MTQYTTVVTGPLGENCYILFREGKAWIIDPGTDEEEIFAELEARQLIPVCIVQTHGHFDHLGALDAMMQKWPDLPVYMRAQEKDWCFTNPMNQYPPFYMLQHQPANLIDAGEGLSLGGISATFIPTPGHTPGGQCILVTEDVEGPLCFTGDTLFKGSVGRTDLPGGSFYDLNKSVTKLANTLAPETTVLPGHGDASTMEYECKYNPYLQDEDPGF